MTPKPMKSTPMKTGATPTEGAISPEEAELKDFQCTPSKWSEDTRKDLTLRREREKLSAADDKEVEIQQWFKERLDKKTPRVL